LLDSFVRVTFNNHRCPLSITYSAGERASARSALEIPGFGGIRMKFDSRDLVLASVFAALYVIINILQMVTVGNPTVYGPIQLRLADCLIPLAALLGFPVVSGVTVGCFLTNAYYFIGVPDIVLGPIANLISASIIFFLRRNRFFACVVGAFPIGFIVGSYLWLFFPPPQILDVMPVWVAMVVSLTISSLIAVAGVGYTLLSIIGRRGIIEPLKSRGLKIVSER
jgi:uncharacterized membrane protein